MERGVTEGGAGGEVWSGERRARRKEGRLGGMEGGLSWAGERRGEACWG